MGWIIEAPTRSKDALIAIVVVTALIGGTCCLFAKMKREAHRYKGDANAAAGALTYVPPCAAKPYQVYLSESHRVITDEYALFKTVDAEVSTYTYNPSEPDDIGGFVDETASRSCLVLREKAKGHSSIVWETTFTFKNVNDSQSYTFDPIFLGSSRKIIFKFGRTDDETDTYKAYVFDLTTKTVHPLDDQLAYTYGQGIGDEKKIDYSLGVGLSTTAARNQREKRFASLSRVSANLSWAPGPGVTYYIERKQSHKKYRKEERGVRTFDTYLYKMSTGKTVLLLSGAFGGTLSPNGRCLAYISSSDLYKDNLLTSAKIRLADLSAKRTFTTEQLNGISSDLRKTIWGAGSQLYLFNCVVEQTDFSQSRPTAHSHLHLYSWDCLTGKREAIGEINFTSELDGVEVFPICTSGTSLLYATCSLSSRESSFTFLRERNLKVWSYNVRTKSNTLLTQVQGYFGGSFNISGTIAPVHYK